ncbi:COX15/CtaA family protein [Piscinibacter sakaiensis]|uniref:Heme A synthase n=1 Tax=Piscinibacter sakaiensis TaxID=1547922 RepID=A0A0K8P112_PISS1|nr:COX15/CtaA family protein [Piscinibacter sakaiensis]GAP36321.1 heme A synthase [Piscinibacter sakaiensis]
MDGPASLVDLSPLLRLALLGLVLALGPLAWVWLRHRGASPARRLQALTLLTAFLTFDLILFGAFTRLTDSGLGCPDWPGCYGAASPIGARDEIHAAQTAMPSGPVTHGKAWVEMIHRYLATGVGVLIVALTAASWAARRAGRLPVSPWWATLTLAWVCAQGAFGALTVTMKLYPAIVTAHLLGGLGLLMLLAAQAQGYQPRPLVLGAGLRRALWGLLALSLVQVALGGWVSTNYAVLACRDFPTCQGRWVPEMDFAHGFAVLRELGAGKDGGYLPFAALTAIHWVHRVGALCVFVALGAVAAALWRSREPAARRGAAWLAGIAAWQLASGLSNVVLGWPLVAAVAHTGGAAALLTALTVLVVRMRQAASPATAAAAGVGAAVAAAAGRRPRGTPPAVGEGAPGRAPS